MTVAYRRPHGISGDGDRVFIPLYAVTSDELDQTAVVGNTASQGTLTLAANASNNDEVRIGEDINGTYVVRAYKYVTTLTASTTENEVLIAGNASDSIDNLIAAINNTGTAGTDYGSETPKHISMSAAVGAGDTMVATARRPGAEGDNLTTTETGTQMSWDAVTLGTTTAGVSGDVLVRIDGGKSFGLVNAPTTIDGYRTFVPDELELLGKSISYVFEDAATKAYADELVIIETTDHPLANHPDGALFAGTATAVASGTLTAEASEDGIAHPLSADVNTAGSLLLFIESATTGAGQSVQIASFVHSTRVFTLQENFPLTPTGTIVYKIYSLGRVPAHILSTAASSMDVAVFQRTFSADYNSKTFEKIIEIIAAAVSGETSGAGTTSEVFKSWTNATTEVTVANDGTNRTSITIP